MEKLRWLWVWQCAGPLRGGRVHHPTQFFRSYLLAFVFWMGLPLGCSAILMLHHMVGGRWGFPLRRCLESGTKNFYLMAVLAVPLLFGLPVLYSWADPEKVKLTRCCNTRRLISMCRFSSFALSFISSFGSCWPTCSTSGRGSRMRRATPELTPRLQSLSGPGLVIFGLTVTYASVDWVMSLEPHWFSTIYGMIFMVTEALAAMAIVTVAVILLSITSPSRT